MHTHPTARSRCIESSPEDSTEDQPIAKELCVLMAQEPNGNAHHIWCVCVCAGLWATSHVAVCVYAAVCVGVVQQWVDDQTERRIGAIFTLCT